MPGRSCCGRPVRARPPPPLAASDEANQAAEAGRGGTAVMRSATQGIGLAAVLGLMAGAATPARAGVVTFMYAGSGAGVSTAGSGSFTFAGNPTTLARGDLTAFSFSQTTTEPFFGTSTFSYGLADLTAFAATLTPGGVLTAL